VVQALPSSRGESFKSIVEYEVVRDLPDPTVPRTGAQRLLRPVELTCRRSMARRRLVRRGFDVGVIELLVYRTDWFDLRALRAQLPLVSVVHDVRPHVHSLPTPLETALLRRLYSEECAGEIIVYSHLLRSELVADFGVDPDRVHVVPHPLDASDLRVEVERPDRPLVLFFGALRPNKGLPVLLAALEQLPRDPGFNVVVAGAGDAATCDLLRRSAERLPFLSVECGFVEGSRKAELYNQASLIVLPYTEFHSVSGVLADAYAYRVPVVVSNVGSLGEVVSTDATGWVVPKGDPTALAEALTLAITALNEESDRGEIIDRIAEAAGRHDYSVVGPQFRVACAKAVEREQRYVT